MNVDPAELARDRRIQHIGYAHTGIFPESHAPERGELLPDTVVRDMAVTAELMGEGTHVAGPLDIILAAQGINTHPLPANIARGHGEIGHGHDHR